MRCSRAGSWRKRSLAERTEKFKQRRREAAEVHGSPNGAGLWPAGLRPAGRAQRGATGPVVTANSTSIGGRAFRVQQSGDAVLHQRNVEIQQQSYGIARQLQVSEQLRLVNRKEDIHSFQFHYDLAVH